MNRRRKNELQVKIFHLIKDAQAVRRSHGRPVTHLVVSVRPLLRGLRWSGLRRPVSPVLLPLTLGVVRILRAGPTLGRTCKIISINKSPGKQLSPELQKRLE